MPTPKYIESPNSVQTSLYGYDRNKSIQVNNLRGKPIVVLRSDTVNAVSENRVGGGSRFAKKWIDRSNQMPAPIPSKPMYPSYSHFHHQYSCTKQAPPPPLSLPNSPKLLNEGPPLSFIHSSHDRNRRPPPSPIGRCAPISPKLTPEDEKTVKRWFDKLEVLTSPTTNCSSNSSYTNVSSDITLLELNPKIASKTFVTSSICVPSSEAESSSISSSPSDKGTAFDTPKSLSDSRRTSCSSDISPLITELSVEDDGTSMSCLNEEPVKRGSSHRCPDEVQCTIFRNGICVDDALERKAMLQWYDNLIQWRHDIITKRRFGPPQCHPPPLTVTLIGASRAQRANSFQRVGDIHPFTMEAMDHVRRKMDAKRSHRLVPAPLPLPAPHEFMANAKCMEPHLFVEYCYQLTAAAYQDTGLTPPHRRPPIPPRIEPIPDQTCKESICSSASEISSDGEYSDDSDDTKQERLRQKMERHRKREHRLQKLFRRRQILDEIDEEDDD
ncbi:hypothetical protein CAEBREN_32720 [Caenorhabditis brenneri]|uniref:Uncharacterized protein n=1 Tax=Caenorhabditis brenneri TaxID=135651 RepID=G0MFV4_CAEBE|nr:hypothetical protein CAEBREN_32720 [Caenorhabditis brenneri]